MMIFHDVWHVLSPQRRERNMFGFKAHKNPLRKVVSDGIAQPWPQQPWSAKERSADPAESEPYFS